MLCLQHVLIRYGSSLGRMYISIFVQFAGYMFIRIAY